MPELPEVETIRNGLSPILVGQRITQIVVRERRLRFLVPEKFSSIASGTIIKNIRRAGKYLLFDDQDSKGGIVIHLGMSGTLRVITKQATLPKLHAHDHIVFLTNDNHTLIYNDPRRFGQVLWVPDYESALFLNAIGIEPLTRTCNGSKLFQILQKHSTNIKNVLMNSRNIAGIGNIYANEVLFRARIHPNTLANLISKEKYCVLSKAIKKTLRDAIRLGGSSIQNFVNAHGVLGHFQTKYFVYGRKNLPCRVCQSKIQFFYSRKRATYYCPQCQHMS